jgi:molybdate transport system substrate-binding protein
MRNRLAYLVAICAAAVLCFAANSADAETKEIRVAAAADLQSALPAIAQRYEAKTGVKLVVSYGSSGTLATQILNGAPFDLFLGADYVFPEKIVAANLADSKDAIPYAKGSLVLWARKDSPLQPLHLEALSDPRVQKIAIADELRAPYGRAAVSALTKLKLYDQLKPKLVVAENVAQASQFVQSGNAQLGLISLTTAMSPNFKEQGTYVLVPNIYPEIRQCAVIIAKSDRRTEAHAFLDWLLTSEIQSDLPKVGLDPVR